MTNEELQSIIGVGDICTISGREYYKFLAFVECEWQIKFLPGYDACKECKGKMSFENIKNKQVVISCHSHGGKDKGKNYSDVEIIEKCHDQILPKELFEI